MCCEKAWRARPGSRASPSRKPLPLAALTSSEPARSPGAFRLGRSLTRVRRAKYSNRLGRLEMIVVDSSVFIAILEQEPEADRFLSVLGGAARRFASAVT